jgi:branched-chain amino acid transport system permease protein
MVNYFAQVVIVVAIFTILACSLNIVFGYAGVFSMSHGAFFGIGAYAAAKIQVPGSIAWPAELLAALLAAGFVAAVSGFFVARLKSDQIIVGTLALQLILSSLFVHAAGWTGGSLGVFGIPRPTIFGHEISSMQELATYTVIVAAASYFFSRTLVRSPFGLALRAGRDDEVLAMSYGRRVGNRKVLAFSISGAMAGLAGALYGSYIGYIEPGTFGLHQSIKVIAIVAIGGLANLLGSVIAATVVVAIPEILLFLPGTQTWVAHVQLMLYGATLLLLAVVRPSGLLKEQPAFRLKSSGKLPPPTPRTPPETAPTPIATRTLEVTGVSKSFGGLKALVDVSLEVTPGVVTALIGPNGAGKSTLFNVISGYETADQGRITWGGTSLVGKPPPDIARMGIARTFQDLRLFFNFTALENLVFPLTPLGAERIGMALLHRRRMRRAWDQARADARQLLEQFDLGHIADRKVGELSYAESKLLAVVMLLERGSPLVLLDEMAAGLDHRTTENFSQLIQAMVRSGQTVCLVEHNLDFVWATADEVIVMHNGAVFARGAPDEIRHNEAVAKAYFGTAKGA